MKNTGQLLKEKREKASLSLSEIALATKINPKILAAIESGDEKNLPAKTFLKGFVRAYAVYLKLDVDEVMRLFHEETGGAPVERVHEINKPEAQQQTASRRRVSDENSSGMRTAAVVLIIMLIGLIIGVRELIEKYQREKVVPPVAVEPLPDSEAKPADPNSEEIAATEVASTPDAKIANAPLDTKTSETAKPTEIKVEPKPAAAEPTKPVAAVTPTKEVPRLLALPTPPLVPTFSSMMKPHPESRATSSKENKSAETKPVENKTAEVKTAEVKTAEVKAPETKPADAKPVETVKPVDVKPVDSAKPTEAVAVPSRPLRNEIILEALDKVEIKFQMRGETKRLALGPTQVHTIQSDQAIILDLSDGGAVNIIVNGRERGVPGDLGKPKQVKIP